VVGTLVPQGRRACLQGQRHSSKRNKRCSKDARALDAKTKNDHAQKAVVVAVVNPVSLGHVPSHAANGHDPSHAADGQAPDGHDHESQGADGQGLDDLGPSGHALAGHVPDGRVPGGRVPDGHVLVGHGPDADHALDATVSATTVSATTASAATTACGISATDEMTAARNGAAALAAKSGRQKKQPNGLTQVAQ